MRIYTTFAVTVLNALLLLGLVACDSPSQTGSAESAGRTRLSVNNNSAEFGDYVVHVNGMSTASLTPEIAQGYGIVRSDSSALINVVILQKSAGSEDVRPVKANVQISAANLTGQVKAMKMREIIDGPSIYYISTVSVDDLETLNVDLDIVPEGSNRNLPVRFSHKFYTR